MKIKLIGTIVLYRHIIILYIPIVYIASLYVGFLTIDDMKFRKKRKKTCFFIFNRQFFNNIFKIFKHTVVRLEKSTLFFDRF